MKIAAKIVQGERNDKKNSLLIFLHSQAAAYFIER